MMLLTFGAVGSAFDSHGCRCFGVKVIAGVGVGRESDLFRPWWWAVCVKAKGKMFLWIEVFSFGWSQAANGWRSDE